MTYQFFIVVCIFEIRIGDRRHIYNDRSASNLPLRINSDLTVFNGDTTGVKATYFFRAFPLDRAAFGIDFISVGSLSLDSNNSY
ncbi:hypothetical protein D3C87_1971370 [compost metagenome]